MLLLMPFFIKFINGITPGDADFIIQTQQQAQALGGAIGDKPFIARHIAKGRPRKTAAPSSHR
jgi:phosphate:Na+ symporter